MLQDSPLNFMRGLFEAAVKSAQPQMVLANFLPEKPKGRCVVVGAGKASAAMAAALEAAWPDVEMSGVVVTRYGHAVPTQKISIIEASHPVPDENSLRAGRDVLTAVQNLNPDDLVIALISGGGSSLLVAPAEGISLADKQDINRQLLKCGAAIDEMNCVRKQLSRIKGGKLAAAAAPARVVTLLISDVPGDDPAIIASGPTVPEQAAPELAMEILRRYEISVPLKVAKVLENAPRIPTEHQAADLRLIATPYLALQAAANFARLRGVSTMILGDAIEGEAAEVGKVLASVADRSVPARPPLLLLSGGETTVTVRGNKPGRGGRNMELMLSAAIALKGHAKVWGLAADTDGIDGTEDAAGACISPDTLQRAQKMHLKPRDFLENHDSYPFFATLNDLLLTGPTLTNVNDFRAFLILP